jgi:hypothetical protein
LTGDLKSVIFNIVLGGGVYQFIKRKASTENTLISRGNMMGLFYLSYPTVSTPLLIPT